MESARRSTQKKRAHQAGGSGRTLNGSLNLSPGSGLQGASGPGHPVVAAPVQIRTESRRDQSALHIRFPVKQQLHLPELIFSIRSLCPRHMSHRLAETLRLSPPTVLSLIY